MRVGSLFSGIGGFDLGLQRAGMKISWQVEIDEWCRKVLAKHWPDVERFGDICNVTKKELKPVELVCGGFPCQPFSNAGKRKGKEDDRYLWPEMLRVISELRPRWVIGENVAGLINMELENMLADLETEGYEVEAFVLPACAIGANHRRDRVWIVAHAGSQRHSRETCRQSGNYQKYDSQTPKQAGRTKPSKIIRSGEVLGNSNLTRLEVRQGQRDNSQQEQPTSLGADWQGGEWWEFEPGVGRVANGISNRMDRLRGLGNAVVPQLVEVLGRYIIEADKILFGEPDNG